jgi:DNA helicase II / ATP-dependent DNA helicase PcrA
LIVMVKLLKNKPEVLNQLQNRYKFFLVDEFQDTNKIQFELIQMLSSKYSNLCIVGDDDQSIYSWRGAEPSYMMDFNTYYPGAKLFKLEQNYRSTAAIVQAATELISRNSRRAPKILWTQNLTESKVNVGTFSDAHDEARFVVDQILQGISQNCKLSQYCVLYRTNAQSRILEDYFRRKALPYLIYGSVRFYERAEIKTLLSYLKLLVNPHDDAAFVRAISIPKRGIGEKAQLSLKLHGEKLGLSMLAVSDRLANGEIDGAQFRGMNSLKGFITLIVKARTMLSLSKKPSEILSMILTEVQFEDFLRQAYPEDSEDRLLNCLELKNALEEFESNDPNGSEMDFKTSSSLQAANILSSFLEQAALVIEPTKSSTAHGEADAVTLMTIHSSKGLEFGRVFVCGFEEGVLPHLNSLDNPKAIEEERRLAYVAMTRAREELYLCAISSNRFRPDMPAYSSRFLSELPEILLNHLRPLKNKPVFSVGITNQHSNSLQSVSQKQHSECEFRVGDPAKHKIFGTGIVQGVEKTIDGFRVEVKFAAVGSKKLLHSYLQPVNKLGELNYES